MLKLAVVHRNVPGAEISQAAQDLVLSDPGSRRLVVEFNTCPRGQPADIFRHDVVISRGPLAAGATQIGAPRRLFEEKLTPVGASSLLRENPVRRAQDVGKHTPIASSSRPGEWEAWFNAAGLGSPLIEGGHRFDHLHVALHAVRDGLGLTMAPRSFFGGPVSRYRLRCPLPGIFVPGETYFVHAAQRPETAEVGLFMEWVQLQCSLAEKE